MGADRRTPAAASGAAVLGSRSFRRQVSTVLALAAEAGAYSVGFTFARGALTGFTVYNSGDSSGGAGKRHSGFTCPVQAAPAFNVNRAAPAQSEPRAAASRAAQPSPQANAQDACALHAHAQAAAESAPTAAARRRRGCRGGAKHKTRTQTGHGRAAAPGLAGSAPERAGAPAAAMERMRTTHGRARILLPQAAPWRLALHHQPCPQARSLFSLVAISACALKAL